MKKIIFSLMLVMVSITFLLAQVPDKVQTSFKAKFPTATDATWTTSGDTYTAMYMDHGVHNMVVYSGDGRIVRTEAEMDMKDYPASVKEYYQKTYPEEKNYHVWVVTDENGNKTYYIPSEHKGVRYYFDKTGKFLREEKQMVKDEMDEHSDK